MGRTALRLLHQLWVLLLLLLFCPSPSPKGSFLNIQVRTAHKLSEDNTGVPLSQNFFPGANLPPLPHRQVEETKERIPISPEAEVENFSL